MGDSRNTGLQPYKYIGKELDRTHGLDWYAHGARHYAPYPPYPASELQARQTTPPMRAR